MSEKARILIVDDEKQIRDSVSELLIDNGYSIGAAASSEEALTKLKDESFDIALVDVEMPKMSGLQLLEKIKTDQPRVDLIMITDYAALNMAVESLKLGAYDLLVKPYNNTKLLESLYRLVEKQTIKDEYKQALEALRQNQEYLENLFNYANAPIIVWDPQFKITRVNQAFESLIGRSADEVIERPLEILFPPDSVRSSMELISKTQRGERWKVVEINILHLDGSVRTVQWNSATIFAPDGKTLVATIAQGQDITERKQAEEKLRKYSEKLEEMVEKQTRKLRESQALLIQAGKMAGLGTLASGIAHEVNNPLGSILTYTQLIQTKSEKGTLSLDTAVDYAGRIEEVVQHCKFTIQNLLDFSRVPEGKANFFSVKEGLLASVSLLAHQLDLQGITVVNDAEDATIFSYKNHLMQVLVDVLTNAKDAMPDGGEIRIATSLEDDRVNISISDTGTGIRQEDLDRIFEPFFTTRDPGQGTGLGLYLCYRIMENLGGEIDVKSIVDKGTTVTIKLPIGKH